MSRNESKEARQQAVLFQVFNLAFFGLEEFFCQKFSILPFYGSFFVTEFLPSVKKGLGIERVRVNVCMSWTVGVCIWGLVWVNVGVCLCEWIWVCVCGRMLLANECACEWVNWCASIKKHILAVWCPISLFSWECFGSSWTGWSQKWEMKNRCSFLVFQIQDTRWQR